MKTFLARQAIYDKEKNIIAYEILYRNSLNNVFDKNTKQEEATYKVIQNISSFGLGKLTNNKLAFINFPEESINTDMATLLPNNKIIIEVLETVEPTKEIIRNLNLLKQKGYSIALDDVSTYKQIEGFLGVIDIVKIDYRISDKYERFNISQKIKKTNIKMLAEKIETKEDLNEAKALGFDYFQGYYFSKPIVLENEDIATRNGTIFNIIAELLKEDFNINRIEELIKKDIGLAYKFLKFINSAYFNFIKDVSSIKHAIMLVGRHELRKWLSIILVSEMNSYIGEEYANNTIIRAKMCELISSRKTGNDNNLAFMVGLFSDINILVKRPLKEVINELPFNYEVKEALLGKDSIYRDILDLVKVYEKMESQEIKKLSNKIGIDELSISDIYLESIDWSTGALFEDVLIKK